MLKKDAEKILEYEKLTIEIQGMCKVKTKVTGLIRQLEPSQNHLENSGATQRESTTSRTRENSSIGHYTQ
jgi:hypothetical protein